VANLLLKLLLNKTSKVSQHPDGIRQAKDDSDHCDGKQGVVNRHSIAFKVMLKIDAQRVAQSNL
jgi:hypothetical protein